jgi:uncharacterized membrane protein YhaH (DUF805 family)
VIRRYTDFDGRSDRPEFWWFGLINLIVSLVLWGIGVAAFGFATGELVAVLYGLVTLLPALGVEIRRLRDTNRSGWWILIGLIPILGGIILIVFFASRGDDGTAATTLQLTLPPVAAVGVRIGSTLGFQHPLHRHRTVARARAWGPSAGVAKS